MKGSVAYRYVSKCLSYLKHKISNILNLLNALLCGPYKPCDCGIV